MLNLVVTLLIIALIAGVLGFGGIAGAAVGIAKIIFVVALVLFLVSLLAGGMRGSFSLLPVGEIVFGASAFDASKVGDGINRHRIGRWKKEDSDEIQIHCGRYRTGCGFVA